MVLHTSLTNGTEYGGSVFQKLSPNLETGVTLGWSSATSATKFGLGAKYVLEDGAVVRAKVNNNSEVGLGYQQKLRDGVTLTLSTLVNGANINAGGHKVGVSLEMSASDVKFNVFSCRFLCRLQGFAGFCRFLASF